MRKVMLPRKSKVTDLLENKVLAEAATEFPLELPPNTSVILKLEESKK
jgi:hypothetical protein